MARNFLTFPVNEKKQITLWTIIKADILPWVTSAGLALLLFVGVISLVGSTQSDLNSTDISANLYTWARPFYYALIVIACFLARRSRDKWTWILAVILILFFIPQMETTLAMAILPNSILQAMIAMIGFLAFGRIVEYINMRYAIKLEGLMLSSGALAGYGLLVLAAIYLDSSLVFKLLWE